MKAVDPTIKIGVVVVTSSENGSYKNWTPTMLARLKTLNAIPDFIIYHLYPQAPGAESDAALLQVADTGSKSWPTIAADLRQQLTANLGSAAGAGVEIVVTENNSVYSSPGKQSTSLVNGLYLADSIGNLMQTEINGYMYWALRNSPPTINNGTALDGNMSASLYGWRQFGDYGMISTPSTLTGETTYYNPYPTYYMMKLLSHFARGGDTIVQATSSNPLLSIFAAKRTDGSLSLLVINKDPTNAQNASIGLNGFSPASTASTYICGKDQDTAAQTGVGSADIATGSISLSGPTFSASFFPYSASVVSLTATTTGTSPVISTQPVARSIGVGQAVAFSVTATGTPAPGYQWQRQTAGVGSWENVSEGGSFRGVSTGVLTIDAISAGMSGDQFRAVVTNASGSVITNAVALTVTGTSLLQYPVGVTVDFSGNIYVADSASNTIRKITTNGVVSTLAGAVGTSGSADGTGGTARFNHPGAIAVDLMGTLYVADTGNSIIRKISSDGIVTTLAGSVSSRGNQDGVGSSATFNSPEGIAVDAAGTIYVADTMNATIRAVTAGGTVSTVAGGVLLRGSQDGNGTVARFSFPSGISVDTAGNLYVSDTDNGTIRKIAADRSVTTLAGLPGVGGTTDSNGTNALFNQPSGLAVDSSGVIYVTDTGNSTIRKVTPTGTVSTFAGLPGISGLGNGSGINALFNQPRAIAINSSGVLFVADTGNAVIRGIAANGNVTALALTEASKPDSGGGASIPPPATTPSVPPSPGSGSSSGGGGAIGECFVAALASLLAARFGLFVRCDR
jgi:sugar lactone lactonase YvrE